MLRVSMKAIAVALFASYGAVEAARISLLKKQLGMKLRKGKPLVTKVNAFQTAEKACCACFKSKYAWPANAGLGAAFAPKQTCDTCYVTDLYGVESKKPIVMGVPAPVDEEKSDACIDRCDSFPDPGCAYVHVEPGTGKRTAKSYFGEGACKGLISDPLFVEQMTGGRQPICETVVGQLCKIACNTDGCGPSAAYETTESKVMAVHEWNWNCASGNAPEDPVAWLKGPVEGEPESARGPFTMCKEDAGWYCPFEEGPDLKMVAGAETPVEVDEGGSDEIKVGTMSLPVIDGSASVAESVSDF